jgi:probable rRNA maturation factor
MKIRLFQGEGVPCLQSRRRFLNFLRRAADLTGHGDAEGVFQFILLSPEEMTELNGLHLGHQGATDVITYDYRDGLVPSPDTVTAEIFICPEVAARQGRKFGQSQSREICLYAVHGLLHLQGEDDLTATARASMRKAEARVLAALSPRFRLDEIACFRQENA